MEALRESIHVPVLFDEVLRYTDPKDGDVIVDATLGGGGHAMEFLKRVGPKGKVFGIDVEPQALLRFAQRLKHGYPELASRFVPVEGNFRAMQTILAQAGCDSADIVLCDLGVSSDELAGSVEGLSFARDEFLDMRLDKTRRHTAADFLAELDAQALADVLKRNADERLAGPIARAIVTARAKEPITHTKALVAIIDRVYGKYFATRSQRTPATKTFQALRILVNDELGNLREGLAAAVRVLTLGGKLAVITFHSGEDRIVKQFMKTQPQLTVLTKHVVTATRAEMIENPRSRSAKLRVAKKYTGL